MISDDANDGMVWEPMWVGRPADTHFSAGGSSPLARADNTNKLETHATLGRRIDEGSDQSDLLKVALGIGTGVLLTIGAFKAVPRMKGWWNDRRATGRNPLEASPPEGEAGISDATALTIATFAAEVETALEEQRTDMSNVEAQRRVLEIMLAAAVIADNMRALSDAQIDDSVVFELQRTMEKLTVPQVTDSLNRMLEGDASILDDRSSADLLQIFGGGRAVEGRYVPLGNDKIAEVLRLPRAA